MSTISETDERFPLYAAIPLEESLFIQDIIRRTRPKQSLEMGCAYGELKPFYLPRHRGGLNGRCPDVSASHDSIAMSALPPKADISTRHLNVR
jgi:hypothetical protein